MEIQLFNSPQFGDIRTAGTPDNPQFCLADVCKALDLRQGDVRQRLSDGVVTTQPIVDSLGREQIANFVNEDGLYDVILDSRKPEAKAFRKWITSEVIPSIRKTGGYIQATQEDSPEEIMAKALQIADNTLRMQKLRIASLEGTNKLLEHENQILTPKAQYYDEVLQAPGTFTHSEMAKELNLRSWKVLVDELKKKCVMFKSQGGKYLLYAKYADKGYTTTRSDPYIRNGVTYNNVFTVWTEEGRVFLHNIFKVPMPSINSADIDMPKELFA